MQRKIEKIISFVSLLIFINLQAALSAKAGDRAFLNIIGYSENLRYFAFEEYGVQDGTGFAYSSIYIVDIKNDSWVVGTPIRVVEEYNEETYEKIPIGTNIQRIRVKAREQADFRLKGLNISIPALALAINGDGESDNDGLSIRYFLPGYIGAKLSDDYRIFLEIFTTQSPLNCIEWFGEQPKGFLIKQENSYGEITEIYRDKIISRSRGCPKTYKIYGVYAPYMAEDLSSSIAIISVYKGGFEGVDRRFIAVPIGNL